MMDMADRNPNPQRPDVPAAPSSGDRPRSERELPPKGRLAEFIKRWESTPDDKGDAYWDEFERELAVNRFNLRRKPSNT
jgi:hypothetical protein